MTEVLKPNKAPSNESWEEEFDKWYPDYGKDMREKATTTTELAMADSEDQRRNKLKAFISKQISEARRGAESLRSQTLEKQAVEVVRLFFEQSDRTPESLAGIIRDNLLNRIQSRSEATELTKPYIHEETDDAMNNPERLSEEPKVNFVQVGQTIECGGCRPGKYVGCEYNSRPCDCKCHAVTDERSWEKRIDDIAEELWFVDKYEDIDLYKKRFREAISESEARMIGNLLQKIEGMKNLSISDYIYNRNLVLDEVIQIIKKGK